MPFGDSFAEPVIFFTAWRYLKNALAAHTLM